MVLVFPRGTAVLRNEDDLSAGEFVTAQDRNTLNTGPLPLQTLDHPSFVDSDENNNGSQRSSSISDAPNQVTLRSFKLYKPIFVMTIMFKYLLCIIIITTLVGSGSSTVKRQMKESLWYQFLRSESEHRWAITGLSNLEQPGIADSLGLYRNRVRIGITIRKRD